MLTFFLFFGRDFLAFLKRAARSFAVSFFFFFFPVVDGPRVNSAMMFICYLLVKIKVIPLDGVL